MVPGRPSAPMLFGLKTLKPSAAVLMIIPGIFLAAGRSSGVSLAARPL